MYGFHKISVIYIKFLRSTLDDNVLSRTPYGCVLPLNVLRMGSNSRWCVTKSTSGPQYEFCSTIRCPTKSLNFVFRAKA